MAVEHIVWIKFNEGVSEERANEHIANLLTLKDRVPGVTRVTAGKNFTERSKGFTHALVVTLEDKAALDAYLPHPEHVAVAAPMKAEAELMAIDFEY